MTKENKQDVPIEEKRKKPKYLAAYEFHIQLINHKTEFPYVKIIVPTDYSYRDLADIIKMYLMYNGNYEYDFYFTYFRYAFYLSSKHSQGEFNDVKLAEYLSVKCETVCSVGSMCIQISSRYNRRLTKVFPIAVQAVGKFPKEDEMGSRFFSKFKKIKAAELEDYLNKNYLKICAINSSPTNTVLTEADLSDFNERLKEYFKNKYKISEERYVCEDEILGNKLVKIN